MLLEINDAVMQFGGLTAVNHVTLGIEEHSICALIGPNGAGKTTLFNMIAGHLKPTSGSIIFDGREIGGLPTYKINHAGISRTYQNINLFRNMTVLENIMVGYHPKLKSGLTRSLLRLPGQRREEREIVEKARQLLHFADLDQNEGEIARNLSYGEMRLTEICRGIATSPKLLLLDEPAAGMNQTEKMELVKLIQTIRDEYRITILIVEHEMRLVRALSEKIFVLNFGSKIAEGTPDEVLADANVIAAYLGGDDSE